MTAATKIINAARTRHQTAAPHADPAIAPAPDLRQLTTTLDHINAELHDTSQPQSP